MQRTVQSFSPETRKVLSNVLLAKFGCNYYKTIMEGLRTVDISIDKTFQNAFTYFYKVRRPQAWLDRFYQYFESVKNEDALTIREALIAIAGCSAEKPQVELSFASKMLHTINPNSPIFDKYVAKTLGLPKITPSRNFGNRLGCAVEIYGMLVERTANILKQ